MTDKQIIIDGVDMSECPNFTFNKIEPNESICISEQSAMCVNNKDCLYKKWKRKEQECERLKEDEKSLLNVIDHLQKTKNEWEEKYNDLGQDFDQLKAQLLDQEAETLKAGGIIYNLEQTLTEIKEIAKIEYPKSLFTENFVEVINHCPYFDCGNCKCLENKEKQNCGGFICSRKQSVYYQENTIYFKQILQKISECGVENEN